MQKGIIPNKARAEELATAQFNATKKEMSANESRGSFFRRRRSSNRRSKSLGKVCTLFYSLAFARCCYKNMFICFYLNIQHIFVLGTLGWYLILWHCIQIPCVRKGCLKTPWIYTSCNSFWTHCRCCKRKIAQRFSR